MLNEGAFFLNNEDEEGEGALFHHNFHILVIDEAETIRRFDDLRKNGLNAGKSACNQIGIPDLTLLIEGECE